MHAYMYIKTDYIHIIIIITFRINKFREKKKTYEAIFITCNETKRNRYTDTPHVQIHLIRNVNTTKTTTSLLFFLLLLYLNCSIENCFNEQVAINEC